LTPLIAAHFGWEMSFVCAATLAVIGALAWSVIDPNQQLAPVQSAGAMDN
jgi:predicted MFS family arabinose efflux permease